MRRTQSKGLQLMKLTIVCCASLSLLSVSCEAKVPDHEAFTHQKRSLPTAGVPASPASVPAVTTPASVTNASNPQTPSDPRACQKLPITPDTWKLLDIDNTLKSLPGGQNMTMAQYAAANGARNFICGIGENCNAGQLCHPVKAPAWQVLYATQEYTSFMNALTDSINYSLSQLQAVAASMCQDLIENISDSRFEVDLKWIFTDMYRGIAYGATALLLITFFASGVLGAFQVAAEILFLTGIGAGIAAWIQGAPKTASFVSWSKLSFYITQAQGDLARHVTEATEKSFTDGITSENGLAKVLAGGHFFNPASPVGLMETTEKTIMRVVQGRLLARLLRAQNAYVTITPDDCHGKGPGGAREGDDHLSYCDPNQKLLFNVVRAHKKKTINTVYGASSVTNKYGFSVEYIVKNSWECQKKYGNFEHDVFADITKVSPNDIMSEDCVINLPVCDMRDDYVRNLKYSRHKTTTYACRHGAGLPI
ncbi:hypothetical protein PTTG_07182 [Puccinia triticina 1-1 BBBD Race 1]|uniref:DUF7872 domain-containing protein n=2 Tax=Puccinia triticina TaxID=208348 RepID=A0A180G5E4_PUCT1|nr:uncharacterized protein PtA15_12A162 [Puccinia triticina]OAV87891.1 hypothetical protein PTTG_07182 [Puccinia triticina 1-1 BBBD Race 1]WAQ90176.1 hypothetical protein PtA15_12A162 [Puccinia triticina]WAR61465.1 hypothetical protein PtB15_12B150 [Puccinia triticina]